MRFAAKATHSKNHNMLTIYKASAGSGKTFTLAYEYIKMLLGVKNHSTQKYCLNSDKYLGKGKRLGGRHRTILAITFTNAATEEMKSRIIKQLAALMTAPKVEDEQYGKWLIRDFGCTGEEIRHAAKLALSELLFDYNGFNVSTIDSFFQSIIRNFAYETEQQGDFEVSLDRKYAIAQSVGLMLDDIIYSPQYASPRLSAWIENQTLSNIEEGKTGNFFNRQGHLIKSITQTLENSMGEAYANNADALIKYLRDDSKIAAFSKALRAKAKEVRSLTLEAANKFVNAVEANGWELKFFNSTAVSRVEAVRKGDKTASATPTMKKNDADSAYDNIKLVVKNSLKGTGYKEENLRDGAELLGAFVHSLIEDYEKAKFYEALDKHLGELEFLGLAVNKLHGYLKDNNLVLLDNTGELLKKIISDEEMPFIYERLGMKLAHLLIDEFQDTSRMQWNNLKPLISNSLGGDNDNLIIGDGKQSIYRFRNSDSALLDHEVQEDHFPNDFIPRGHEPADNTNHRSFGNVVRFNNALFNNIGNNPEKPINGYQNVIQTPSDKLKDKGGFIRIDFRDYSSVTEPAENINPEKPFLTTYNQVFENMAQEILRQHNESGYKWRDILILSRMNNTIADVVNYFSDRYPQIPVLSSEALLLKNSTAVRTIMSMLKLVQSSYGGADHLAPKDSKYVSQSEVCMVQNRFAYFHSIGFSETEALEKAINAEDGDIEGIHKDIMSIRRENPANLVALMEAIITHKLSPALHASEFAYIAALQDLAILHADSPDPSIASFIKYYETNSKKLSIKAGANIDAVELMTIHKSKGLQRACVHIPVADWEEGSSRKPIQLWMEPAKYLPDFDPEILPPAMQLSALAGSALRADYSPVKHLFQEQEHLMEVDGINLAYVAYTRAERELFVHCSGTKYMGDIIEPAINMHNPGIENCLNLPDFLNEDKTCFECGERTLADKNDEEESTMDKEDLIVLNEYYVKFRPLTAEITCVSDVLAPEDEIGNEEQKEIVDQRKPDQTRSQYQRLTERGIHLHNILSDVPTLDRLKPAFERYARRKNLTDKQIEEYFKDLEDAFTIKDPRVAQWFDKENRIFAERSIYDNTERSDKENKQGKIYRPDRIVLLPDGSTAVIDYKFTSEARPEHFKQVEKYLQLLGQMGISAKGYLWYPLLKIVKDV